MPSDSDGSFHSTSSICSIGDGGVQVSGLSGLGPKDEEDPSEIASLLLRQIYASLKKESTSEVKPDAPQVQEVPASIPASRDSPELSRWRCVWRGGMDVRSQPQVQRTGITSYLKWGEEFGVCEERPGRDGTVFLKLSDSEGWVFTQTRSGRFCVPVEKEPAAENAWRDYQGPAYASWDYDSHGTWSTSSTWRDREWSNNHSWAQKDYADAGRSRGWAGWKPSQL